MVTTEDESKLESRVTGLERDVQNLAKLVKGLAEDSHALATKIDESLNAMRRDSRTNWGTLASWAAVVIAFISAIGYLAIDPIRYLAVETARDFRAHEMMEGHPTAVALMKNLEKRYDEIITQQATQIAGLDTALQREMRDLDTQSQLKIEALDKSVQKELSLVRELYSERLKCLERRTVENQ